MSQPPPAERPLVTFALFAYNQEDYVREAIEGAFAQTYEPLEIILSDDCSTDRTFEIMQEMAEGYGGPHEVRVRQSERNRGLLDHINEAARCFRGELVVVNAGDDVSESDRVSVFAQCFNDLPKAHALLSDFQVLGRTEPRRPEKAFLARRVPTLEILMNGGGVGKGATYAYSRQAFLWPCPLPHEIVSEDRILPLRAALLGRVYSIDRQLLRYREAVGPERYKKKKRALGYNHPNHWQIVRDTVAGAASDGMISYWQQQFLGLVISLKGMSLRLSQSSSRGSRIVGGSIHVGLRLLRKTQARPSYHLDLA